MLPSPTGFFAALRMTLLYGEPCYSHSETPMADKNQLYYGYNLDVLRRYMRDGTNIFSQMSRKERGASGAPRFLAR